MKNLKLSAPLLVLCCVLALASCGESVNGDADGGADSQDVYFEIGEKVVVADGTGCGFTIVRPENCDKSVTDVAVWYILHIRKLQFVCFSR